MKTYDVVLYECSSCAYATSHAGNAAKHATTKKCPGGSMSGKSHRVVKVEDAAPRQETTTPSRETTVPGFECPTCGYATADRSNAAKHAKKCGAEIALAHLRVSVLSTRPRVAAPRFRKVEKAAVPAVPEGGPKLDRPIADMRLDMERAIARLGAHRMDITESRDIPALLFRAARGADAPARYLAIVDEGVVEMRPGGGVERTTVKRFLRRILADAVAAVAASDLGGEEMRELRRDLDEKTFQSSGRAHSRADLLRMYAASDPWYYKASPECKEFVETTLVAVRYELDALRADRVYK